MTAPVSAASAVIAVSDPVADAAWLRASKTWRSVLSVIQIVLHDPHQIGGQIVTAIKLNINLAPRVLNLVADTNRPVIK